ncbi:MAG: hypothetical protein AAF664_10580 [Planctomycetota bacterium]
MNRLLALSDITDSRVPDASIVDQPGVTALDFPFRVEFDAISSGAINAAKDGPPRVLEVCADRRIFLLLHLKRRLAVGSAC